MGTSNRADRGNAGQRVETGHGAISAENSGGLRGEGGSGGFGADEENRRFPRAARAWRVLRKPVVTDCWVTALALFLSVTSSVQNPMLGPADVPWINHTLATVAALPLLARRRYPEVAAMVALVGFVTHASIFVTFFAFFAVGVHRGTLHRRVAWGSAAVGLVILAPWTSLPHIGLTELMQWLLFSFPLQVLVPLLIGLNAGARQAVLAALTERAERAEREQLLIAEAARVEERTRIAGEMHDVVSHQVSLIVVHANALEVTAHDPETSREAAATIRTAGRQALDELREMIGVLRHGADEGGFGSASEERRPQPTLAQIPALTDSSRTAGLSVALRVEGEQRPLPDPAERAAYRVVQEALTNVHKHAPGADTDVQLLYGAEALHVTVTNGRPSRSPKGKGSGTDSGEALLPSGGHGLIGLGERVRLAGGSIDSGRRPGGGFRVRITLPIEAGCGAADAEQNAKGGPEQES